MRRSVVLLLAIVFAVSMPAHQVRAATGTASPFVKLQFLTNAGAPAASHKLFVYTSGTSTKTTTYTDAALSSANTNPIVLDSAGRCVIFLVPGTSVKYVLTTSADSDPPLSPIWTVDAIQAVPGGAAGLNVEISATAGESLTANDSVYLSDGTGGTTAGRWYRTDADVAASSVDAQATGFAVANISTGATGLIRRGGQMTGLTGLTPGSVYYASSTSGAITATPPTNVRVVAQADSSTVLSIILSGPDAGPTIGGQINTSAQSIAGAKAISGTWTFTPTPMGVTRWSRCTADLVKNNNATVSNATGLAFAVGAGETWTFQFHLRVGSATTPDAKFALTGPAAYTAVWYGVGGSSTGLNTPSTAAFGNEIATNTGGIAQPDWFMVSGQLRNGANAGTVQLQFAQNTATVGDSTLYADSYVIAFRHQ